MLSPLLLWGSACLGAIALSLYQAGGWHSAWFNPGGWEQLWQFLQASVHPDLSIELLGLTAKATLTTLAYAVCGTWLSLILGLIGGIFTSEVWWLVLTPTRQSPPIALWSVIRGLLSVPRAIHELIWGLFFVHLWGLDPLTGVLAIALPFGAITAKVFSEILDETPRPPLLALLHQGVPPATALLYGLLPQAGLNLVSYAFYRFECSLRSAAVLGIIGAGGLGYQILLSLQSLRYEQLWTFFYALVLLNGLVDFSSAWLRRSLGCASRLDLQVHRRAAASLSRAEARDNRSLLLLSVGVILVVPFCFWYVGADFSKLWLPRTGQLLQEIVMAAWPGDWSGIFQLVPLSLETVAMSVLAIALAASGGILLSFPAAHNLFLPGALLNPGKQSNGAIAWAGLLLTRLVLLFCRAIPAPIWALVVLFVMFPGILPGAIALGLHNLGILGRLMAEVTENLDQRPLEALKAQGASSALVFLYGVLPLTLPRFLSYILYRWEVCLRETVIVGLVGAGGLGRLLTEQLSSFDYRGLVVTLGCFVILTYAIDWISTSARRSLR